MFVISVVLAPRLDYLLRETALPRPDIAAHFVLERCDAGGSDELRKCISPARTTTLWLSSLNVIRCCSATEPDSTRSG